MSSRIDRVLLGLLAVSLAFNLAQRGLPEWITDRFGPAPAPTPPSPLVGRRLASAQVKTRSGKAVTIDYAKTPTILYVVSPQCEWCKANTPVITALARAQASSYRFVGLSMSQVGLDAYLDENPLPFETLVIPNPLDPQWQDYGLGATPYMVAVNGEGSIAGAWAGALLKNNRAAVLEFFKLSSLPGLKTPT